MKRFKFFQTVALLLCTASITLIACCDDNEPPGNDNPPPVIQLADESLQQQSFAPDKLTGSFSFEATAAWTATVVETTDEANSPQGQNGLRSANTAAKRVNRPSPSRSRPTIPAANARQTSSSHPKDRSCASP